MELLRAIKKELQRFRVVHYTTDIDTNVRRHDAVPPVIASVSNKSSYQYILVYPCYGIPGMRGRVDSAKGMAEFRILSVVPSALLETARLQGEVPLHTTLRIYHLLQDSQFLYIRAYACCEQLHNTFDFLHRILHLPRM